MNEAEAGKRFRDTVERFSLAAAIRYPELFDESGLGPTHFLDAQLSKAASVIPLCLMRNERKSIPLQEVINRSGVSVEILRQVVAADSPTPEQAREWWRRLLDHAAADALAGELRALVMSPRPEMDALSSLVAKIESKLQEHSTTAPESNHRSILDAGNMYIARKREELASGVRVGIKTGLTFVDQWIGGLNPGELTTIVAGGGVGKTTVADDLCRRIAERGDVSLYFASEMTEMQTGQRIVHGAISKPISDHSSITRDELDYAESEFKAHNYLDRVKKTYSSGVTASRILAVSRQVERKFGLGLVVFDHLGCFNAEKPKASEQEQVATAVQAIKDLSVLLNVPFVLLTHLNRTGEIRASERVKDLSDNVIMLQRGKDGNWQQTVAQIVKARQCGDNVGREMALQYSLKWQSFCELHEGRR